MPVTPSTASSFIESGVQLFLAIYREVVTAEIIKKANGKYDKGLRVLEACYTLMTWDQIEQIDAMWKCVEAAWLPHPSEMTAFLDLIRNPFNNLNNAWKFRKICKEYKQLVQHISQVARAERYLLFTSSEENGSLSQSFRPVVKASHTNGVQIFMTQEVALEIERAAGPGAEMTMEFCGLKILVGATTSMKLQFTSSGNITVALGLIQDPSLVQREDGAALVLAASRELAQAEEVVRIEDAPHHMTSQPDASGRTPVVISLSGTATIFSRQKDHGDLNHGDARTRKKVDVVNRTNGEDSGGKVTYALRLDNLTFHAEVVIPASD